MDVGLYIDGFNLYYGGRSYFGSRPGWRWLDLRALATDVVGIVGQKPAWHGAALTRVVYCTARTGDPDPAIPVRIQDGGKPVATAVFMASVAHREEKGSDVNLATHLLMDVLSRTVGAAIVITNDSDLKLPLSQVRNHVPVGLLNPGNPRWRPTAGALKSSPTAGVGGHWWGNITAHQYLAHQRADPITDPRGKAYTKPPGW